MAGALTLLLQVVEGAVCSSGAHPESKVCSIDETKHEVSYPVCSTS